MFHRFSHSWWRLLETDGPSRLSKQWLGRDDPQADPRGKMMAGNTDQAKGASAQGEPNATIPSVGIQKHPANNGSTAAGIYKPVSQTATSLKIAPVEGTIKIEQSSKDSNWFGLAEALAWPAIAAIAIWLFHKQIGSILAMIADRLAKGAPVEGPWGIKIGAVPQSPAQEVRKVRNDVNELFQAEPHLNVAEESARASLTTLYLAAEDLALREVQAEFRSPVSRNMTTGGQKFDGIFAVGQIPYLVEVKLVRSQKSEMIARQSVNQLADAISRIGWPTARGLLVVVYDSGLDIHIERDTIQAAARLSAIHVEVRVYNLRVLAEKYGLRLPVP